MFRDRIEAGQALAAEFERLIAQDPSLGTPVVLALPRGGVPVAFKIARRLNALLDLVLVRKIGVPGQPELAAAAVVDGDEPKFGVNPDVIAQSGITTAEIEVARRRELAEIERRREMYFSGRGRTALSLTGRERNCFVNRSTRTGRDCLLPTPIPSAEAAQRLRRPDPLQRHGVRGGAWR